MITFTETVIDLADRHSTLVQFGESTCGLPMGSREEYSKLFASIASKNSVLLADVAVNPPKAAMLNRLRPAYRDNKYWHRVMGTRQISAYGDRGWDDVVPLEATLTIFVNMSLAAGRKYSVKPQPRVLLYPFGWSTWLSLRVMGVHSLPDLAELIKEVFTQDIFDVGGTRLDLLNLLDKISEGVRTDAFAGAATNDLDNQDIALVTTVLAKHGGTYAATALGTAEQQLLRRIVRPVGPATSNTFDAIVLQRKSGVPGEYLIRDDRSRFIWIEPLLEPTARNNQLLRCHHNNAHRSRCTRGTCKAFLTGPRRKQSQRAISPRSLDLRSISSKILDSGMPV